MLSQTSESCGRFVLHCMRRRVQELEDAADPSWLHADVLTRLPNTKRVGHLPYESNRPCSLVGLHR